MTERDGKTVSRISCATMRIQGSILLEAEERYLKKFGFPAPIYLADRFNDYCIRRAEIVQRAVDNNAPLSESPAGEILMALEREYAHRFRVYPRPGLLWMGSGKDDDQEKIAVLQECLATGRRRLRVEYGMGDGFPRESLPEKWSSGLLM